jgi:amino acid permease
MYSTFSDGSAVGQSPEEEAAADAYRSWPNIHGSLAAHSSPLSSRRRTGVGVGGVGGQGATPLLNPMAAGGGGSAYGSLQGGGGGGDGEKRADGGGDGVGECNFFQASFNSVNLLFGVGVLSLPFAVTCAGWLIAVPLLAILSLMTNYTGKLLGRCMEYRPPKLDLDAHRAFKTAFPFGVRTYPDIGEAAFGRRGRIFISIIFFTELFCACCMYLILMGDNLHTLFPQVTSVHFTMLAFLVVLPTTWTSQLTLLSYTSLLGIIASFFLFVVLVYAGLTSPANPVIGGSLLHPVPTQLLAPVDRMPLVLGLIMVGFAGHACFPSVYMSMRNREQYPAVLNLTYCVTGSIYMLVAICGYLMYGQLTAQEVTVNLVQSHPGTLSALATWLIVINPSTKFALTLFPVSTSLEDLLLPRLGQGKWCQAASKIAIRSCLTTCVMLLAISIPSFARVVSFIGAFCSFVVSGAFPAACYLKLYGKTLSTFETVLNKVLVVFCAVCSLIGTVASIVCPTN